MDRLFKCSLCHLYYLKVNAGSDPVLYSGSYQAVCWCVLAPPYSQDNSKSSRNEQGDDGEQNPNDKSYIF